MVLIKNLPVLTPALENSPCRILFGIVTSDERLVNALLVPFLTGEGKILYALAIGLKITLSKPWFKAKVALFYGS